MPTDFPLVAVQQGLLLLFVIAGYVLLGRRIKVLAHPLSIVVGVTVVGLVVSIVGAYFREGWDAVPQMAVRAGVGSGMWGAQRGRSFASNV